MAYKKDEVYVCPDPDCGCELTVTKGAPVGCAGKEVPSCCCGKKMMKKETE